MSANSIGSVSRTTSSVMPAHNIPTKPTEQTTRKPLTPTDLSQSVQQTGPQETVQQIQQSVNQNQNPLSTSNTTNVAMNGV